MVMQQGTIVLNKRSIQERRHEERREERREEDFPHDMTWDKIK